MVRLLADVRGFPPNTFPPITIRCLARHSSRPPESMYRHRCWRRRPM